MVLFVESFNRKRSNTNANIDATIKSTDILPLPNPYDNSIATTEPPDEHITIYDENIAITEEKEVGGREGLLAENEEVEVSAINKEYLPEKVFSKSRFHVMGEIKRSLQELVTREYTKQHSLPPSRFAHLSSSLSFINDDDDEERILIIF